MNSPAAALAAVAAARSDAGKVVLEGFHPLKHALRFGAEVEVVLTDRPARLHDLATALAPDVIPRLNDTGLEPVVVTREQLRAAAGTLTSPALAVARRPTSDLDAALADRSRPAVALEDPRHGGNIGAVIRVAAAAGAAAVMTTGQHDPWHPSTVRGAAGLHFAVPVARTESFPDGRPLVALDADGAPLDEERLPDDALLVFGTERHGLRPETLDRAARVVRLPMRTGVSSLNLATSVAAALYGARFVSWRPGHEPAAECS